MPRANQGTVSALAHCLQAHSGTTSQALQRRCKGNSEKSTRAPRAPPTPPDGWSESTGRWKGAEQPPVGPGGAAPGLGARVGPRGTGSPRSARTAKARESIELRPFHRQKAPVMQFREAKQVQWLRFHNPSRTLIRVQQLAEISTAAVASFEKASLYSDTYPKNTTCEL